MLGGKFGEASQFFQKNINLGPQLPGISVLLKIFKIIWNKLQKSAVSSLNKVISVACTPVADEERV